MSWHNLIKVQPGFDIVFRYDHASLGQVILVTSNNGTARFNFLNTGFNGYDPRTPWPGIAAPPPQVPSWIILDSHGAVAYWENRILSPALPRTYYADSVGPFSVAQGGDGLPFVQPIGPNGYEGESPVEVTITVDATTPISAWSFVYLNGSLGGPDASLGGTSRPSDQYYVWAFWLGLGAPGAQFITVAGFTTASSGDIVNQNDTCTILINLSDAPPQDAWFVLCYQKPDFGGGINNEQWVSAIATGVVPAGTTSGTITFAASDAGTVGETRRLYIAPTPDAHGYTVGSGLILDNYTTYDLTIKKPVIVVPPPKNPVTTITHQIDGVMGMTTGGGSPRMYILISRDTKPGGNPTHSTRVRCCRSDDFGKTFTPGVDIGAHDHANAVIAENQAGQFGFTLRYLPGGVLYANGDWNDGSLSAPWYTARLSNDGGQTWSNGATLNGATDGGGRMIGNLLAPWVTRGGAEGAHGSGTQAGGAHRVLKRIQSGNTIAESLDNGSTWQYASDLGTLSDTYMPLTQPITIGGVSYDGHSWSEDDYTSVSGRHDLTDFPRSNAVCLMPAIADTDVTYRFFAKLFTVVNNKAIFQATLTIGRQGLRNNGGAEVSVTKDLWVSGIGDGANLTPLPTVGVMNVVGWVWKSHIVVMCLDRDDQSRVQVYASDNEGDWFRKTCHTIDAGQTWITD